MAITRSAVSSSTALADGCIVKELRSANAHDILSAIDEVNRL